MGQTGKKETTTILALDTALGACSVAIRRGELTLASAFELRQSGHAEALMPMISLVTAKAGLTLDDIDIFATTLGPGTFTGLRISLSAARGLAQALDRPLIGFSTLEVIAWGALAHLQAPPFGHLVIVHDARRREVYAQSFAVGEEPGGTGLSLEAVGAPCLLALDHIAGFLPPGAISLAGSGASLALENLPRGTKAAILTGAPQNPDAAYLAALAARRLATGPSLPPQGYLALPPVAPIYLRAPDAKLPKEAAF